MIDHRLHQRLANAATAKFIEHKHVTDVRKSREVAYHAAESYEAIADKRTEAQGVFDRSSRLLERPITSPVCFLRKEAMNETDIQAVLVRTYLKLFLHMSSA